jgi:hypothetical protein
MNEISSGVAFWILDVWRKMAAQLQVNAFEGRGEKLVGSSAVILRTSPNNESLSIVAVTSSGQNAEWTIPLKDCKFGFGVAGESPAPEFIEGRFVSCLVVDMPEDKHLVFRERFVDIVAAPR